MSQATKKTSTATPPISGDANAEDLKSDVTGGPAEASPSPTGHAQWEGSRLLLSLAVCALLIVAAVIYDKCG